MAQQLPSSGGHTHGAPDLKPATAHSYVLHDDGTWGQIVAANLATEAVESEAIKEGAVITAHIAADAITTTELDPSTIQYAVGTITNAQIKALRAAPKTLVAAPGAGYVHEFVSAMLFLDYGTNVLTESADNLAIKYTDGSGQAVSETIEATAFIDASGDAVMPVKPIASAVILKAACTNAALVLHNTGDGEYAGNAGLDSVIRFKVAYRTHLSDW